MNDFIRSFTKAKPFHIIAFAVLFTVSSCTTYTLDEDRAAYYSLQADNPDKQLEKKDSEFSLHAPALKVFDAHESSNKVGKPMANADGSVYIDSSSPAFYTVKQTFQIEDRKYTNLIYRVHFSEIPLSIFPYHLSWGKNVGLIFVVTLNEEQQPVLFVTAHTCGCYMAMMGTSFTPDSFYPDSWAGLDAMQKVYGERLPRKVELSEQEPDICVAIKPHVHRIMDVFPCDKSKTELTGASEFPLQSLRSLESENGPVSFFYEDGYKEGLVKGAVKPWESMFLSWPSLDPYVGTDKAFLKKDGSERSFYTSIKPWRREVSDMTNFPRFLDYWGWRL